jgi:hypothetical protein
MGEDDPTKRERVRVKNLWFYKYAVLTALVLQMSVRQIQSWIFN